MEGMSDSWKPDEDERWTDEDDKEFNKKYGKEQGTKHDKEKLDRFDLIPPDILLELAELYGMGAKKYDDRNWQKGIKWGRVVRALMSHLTRWLMGEKYDKEDGQRHLISVIWCAIALAWFEKHNKGEDDRWLK